MARLAIEICGAANAALSATQKRRRADYSEKLLKAERVIEAWPGLRNPNPKNWKKWVVVKMGTEISAKWFTRAVNLEKVSALVGRG